MRDRLEGDDPTFAAEHRLPVGEDDFEPQNDPLRARLGTKKNDARPRHRVEFALEKFILGREGTRDADRDGRFDLVSHEPSISENAPRTRAMARLLAFVEP